jgi:hypothetical protein
MSGKTAGDLPHGEGKSRTSTFSANVYCLFFIDYSLFFIDQRLFFTDHILFFIDYCLFFIDYLLLFIDSRSLFINYLFILHFFKVW